MEKVEEDGWPAIRVVPLTKRPTRGIPTSLKEGDLETTDAREVTNKFNKYFASIGVRVGDLIDPVDKTPYEYIVTSYWESFFLSPVSRDKLGRR